MANKLFYTYIHGSDSKMYQLPKDVLDQVNDMLLNENMKYSDIQHWLETEHDMKISLSSISNYAVLTAVNFSKNSRKTVSSRVKKVW